jgi:hypothetical protein
MLSSGCFDGLFFRKQAIASNGIYLLGVKLT